MRVAAVVAVFVVLLVAGLVGVVVPATGQTVPPPTETPCIGGDCGPVPTARPTDGEPGTPDPGCTGECNPVPTPRPPDSMTTPLPGCTDPCFPFPTPRPTYAPGATIEPAYPGNGTGIWYYSFMPTVRLRH